MTDLKWKYYKDWDLVLATFVSTNWDTVLYPLCPFEPETTTHYFLRHFYNSNWATLMNGLENILISISTVSDKNLTSLLLYGDGKFDDTKNRKIWMPTIKLIKDSQRFDEQRFW